MAENDNREYITEEEARGFKRLFEKCLKDYKKKDANMSDQEWLKSFFLKEIPDITEEEAGNMAAEATDSIHEFNENYQSVNGAAKKGISKESWVASKISDAAAGVSTVEFGKHLEQVDAALYQKNLELADALHTKSGAVNMNPNLNGNIAEDMIAGTADINGLVQGKNVKVDVLGLNTKDSVDVRAMNLRTGEVANYQLKFGKDAQATIRMIEAGNYEGQKIIVPTEQLNEVQAYYQEKGIVKDVSDRISAFGVEGKPFTKAEVEDIQSKAQTEDIMPELDYNDFRIKDIAKSIGKNVGVMALLSAAMTTGFTVVRKLFKKEPVEANELITDALKSGADSSVKIVTTGTLEVAVRKGIISFIPKGTSVGILANIACVAIENVKILLKVARGRMSITEGLDMMGRSTTAMVGGLWGAAQGMTIGMIASLFIPVAGPVIAVAIGLVGGMVGYFGGAKIGELVYEGLKKVASVAKKTGETILKGMKRIGRAVATGVRTAVSNLFAPA